MTLIERGTFRLPEKDHKFYMNSLTNLLTQNYLVMKNNNANIKTLKLLAKKMYKDNLKVLQQRIRDNGGNSDDIIQYLRIYEKFS